MDVEDILHSALSSFVDTNLKDAEFLCSLLNESLHE